MLSTAFLGTGGFGFGEPTGIPREQIYCLESNLVWLHSCSHLLNIQLGKTIMQLQRISRSYLVFAKRQIGPDVLAYRASTSASASSGSSSIVGQLRANKKYRIRHQQIFYSVLLLIQGIWLITHTSSLSVAARSLDLVLSEKFTLHHMSPPERQEIYRRHISVFCWHFSFQRGQVKIIELRASEQEVAVKLEPVRTQHPQLLYEAKVIRCAPPACIRPALLRPALLRALLRLILHPLQTFRQLCANTASKRLTVPSVAIISSAGGLWEAARSHYCEAKAALRTRPARLRRRWPAERKIAPPRRRVRRWQRAAERAPP
jgi:hypothetical protein